MTRLHALFVLAWALLRALVDRAFGRTTGLARFREHYAADRLPPATPEERAALPSMSGCIACGLCDLGATRSGHGPMSVALADARQTPDADAALVGLAALPDALLSARERVCPTHVPLVAIARLTRERAVSIAKAAS